MFPPSFSGLQLILLGLSMLSAAFVLRRVIVLRRAAQRREPLNEVRADMRAAEQAEGGRLRELELRLYQYGRETEGRLETRMAVLDELISAADQEIVRLSDTLEHSRQWSADNGLKLAPDASHAAETLSPRERQMIHHLRAAGYRAEEVAQLIGRPLPWSEDDHHRRDAA